MSATTCQCPNCNASLTFDTQTQEIQCEYCGDRFDRQQFDSLKSKQTKPSPNQQHYENTALYICPSCGTEIVTDETTAAINCFFCHSTVVFSEKLEGKYRPDLIIPFAIDKDKAVEEISKWTKKKWFIPKAFFDKEKIEEVNGVYFPYWLVEGRMEARMQGSAKDTRKYSEGDYEVTETKYYNIARSGWVDFEKTARRGLDKEENELIDTVHPYDFDKAIEFSSSYLLGFQAVKRNVESGAHVENVTKEMQECSSNMMKNTISGYDSVSINSFLAGKPELLWRYILLPVWTLTYRWKDGETYYFTMNGQSGKVTGKLPLNKTKMYIVIGMISLIISLAVLLYLF